MNTCRLNQISEATCARFNVTTLTQKTFGIDGVGGDCQRTAVACLLGLPNTDNTPHFCDMTQPNPNWVVGMREYLHGFGVTDMWSNTPDHLTENFNGVVGILAGRVEGSPALHSVVAVIVDQHPIVIWDPHPSRVGLLEDTLEDFMFLSVLRPSVHLLHRHSPVSTPT